ncbi:hypothetical protein V7024_15375 [Bacillus sp. JJ864]|uniref:hypothetical protein n=1 Tax=Bacillus sp. JJ864 TaxID=3122975 RepID=UPI002FFFB616
MRVEEVITSDNKTGYMLVNRYGKKDRLSRDALSILFLLQILMINIQRVYFIVLFFDIIYFAHLKNSN